MLDELVEQVISRLKAASEFVFDKREKISRQSGLENVRKQREHALVHPHLSTTPLPEALDRANNVLWKLEREAAPLVKTATAALLAIDQAAREVKAVETAITNKRASERSASLAGLYKEAVRVIDKLADYGAKKWVLRQQTAPELRIYADLMRWKAADQEHDDPNSPWHLVFAAYRDRQMDVEVDPGQRYGTSMPQHVADARAAKRRASTPPVFDLSIMPAGGRERRADVVEQAETPNLPAPAPSSVPPAPTASDAAPVTPSAGGIVDVDRQAPTPALPPASAAPEIFNDVALLIVAQDGVDKALWQEVGYPSGSAEYDEIVRNGEAAIARGSLIPHLFEFVAAARQRYPSAFLGELRQDRARRLAEVLAADPSERARFRAQGFDVPGD